MGNKGFDPLGFATSLTTLKAYREAELKHGRLAMLAALGWPVSELLQPVLASKMARISHWQKFSIRWLGMVYTLGHCD